MTKEYVLPGALLIILLQEVDKVDGFVVLRWYAVIICMGLFWMNGRERQLRIVLLVRVISNNTLWPHH